MLRLFLITFFFLRGYAESIFERGDQGIVIETRQIILENFPDAHNPSILKVGQEFLLTFRYQPDEAHQPWLSEVWVVWLDRNLMPLGEPQLLNTRPKKSKTPSQAEDARFFRFRDKIFLLYNDNVDEIFFDRGKRRDMFIAELTAQEGLFQLSSPLKLFCEEKYNRVLQQKNWIPFEWKKGLYFIYSICPHEVLTPNLKNGTCYSLHKTAPSIEWQYGSLRGSSDAQLIDGEYWAFFHSSMKLSSPATHDWTLWHYFMGLYIFSADPPFAVRKISPEPIMADEFYTSSYREKRVIFPGGFIVDGPYVYVAYGKDDGEIWIATLDKEALKASLIAVP